MTDGVSVVWFGITRMRKFAVWLVANAEVSNGFKSVPSMLEEVLVVDQDNLLESVVADGFHRQEDLQ